MMIKATPPVTATRNRRGLLTFRSMTFLPHGSAVSRLDPNEDNLAKLDVNWNRMVQMILRASMDIVDTHLHIIDHRRAQLPLGRELSAAQRQLPLRDLFRGL